MSSLETNRIGSCSLQQKYFHNRRRCSEKQGRQTWGQLTCIRVKDKPIPQRKFKPSIQIHLFIFYNVFFNIPLWHVLQLALTCMGHVQDQLAKNKLNHKITLQSPSTKPTFKLSSLSCCPEAAHTPVTRPLLQTSHMLILQKQRCLQTFAWFRPLLHL